MNLWTEVTEYILQAGIVTGSSILMWNRSKKFLNRRSKMGSLGFREIPTILENLRLSDSEQLFRDSFICRTRTACRASGLTVAHLLGHASTQILPTYVKPLDENTKAVIEALDVARMSSAAHLPSIQ